MMGRTGRVLITGPLARFADGFSRELERLGYSPSTIEAQLHLMAHLSGWLDDRGLDAEQLTGARVEEFLVYQRACGRAHRCSPQTLSALLGFLRWLGVLSTDPPQRHRAAVARD